MKNKVKVKVKEFIEEHKKGLAITAVSVAGIAIWLITKDKNSNYSELPRPELPTGEWVQLFRGDKGKYAGSVTGFVNAVDVEDLGKFGEALKTIDTIGEHEPIRIMFGTERSFT